MWDAISRSDVPRASDLGIAGPYPRTCAAGSCRFLPSAPNFGAIRVSLAFNWSLLCIGCMQCLEINTVAVFIDRTDFADEPVCSACYFHAWVLMASIMIRRWGRLAGRGVERAQSRPETEQADYLDTPLPLLVSSSALSPSLEALHFISVQQQRSGCHSANSNLDTERRLACPR